MKAVILAAGKGSRLAPFTDIIPKPLMPVGINREGRFYTIIEKIISQIKTAGIVDIFIVVNYKAELIMQYLKEDAGMSGLRLTYLMQSELDGNAGAFYRAQHLLDNDSVLVTDCDNFIDDQTIFKELRDEHTSSQSKLTVGVCEVDNVSKFAIIKTDSSGTPVDIFEKPEDSKEWGNLAKSGVMILSADLAVRDRSIAAAAGGEYTTTEIVRYCIEKGEKLSLYPFSKGFSDIGTWSEYIAILRNNL